MTTKFTKHQLKLFEREFALAGGDERGFVYIKDFAKLLYSCGCSPTVSEIEDYLKAVIIFSICYFSARHLKKQILAAASWRDWIFVLRFPSDSKWSHSKGRTKSSMEDSNQRIFQISGYEQLRVCLCNRNTESALQNGWTTSW